MATISTSQTLDSAARTAGEAMTINSGAILTINTHTRFHANAPASATGSLGSFTMTAASGGQAFIDGQSVRMVAYSGGTGNVPAYNTSVTQGGVTGVFLCAMSTLATAPTAVGAAMPATGYIMFKSVSGGSFAAGALKVHSERVAKVQQYQKLLAAQKKSADEKPVEVPALLKPPEQLVINETALRYTQDALSLTDETQAFEISPELVAKLAEISKVSIEKVEIPDISPEHLALIRNNDDALAMILIYWAIEDA